jgi:uncharacterized membrane-anchored protein
MGQVMKFATRSPRPVETSPPGLVGTARVARRTQALLPRLRPGDIAVVDHLDLDRATAQRLLDAGVRAVVNASAMISGRYATLGPEVLAAAGVTLVDRVGPELMTAVKDGARLRLDDGVLYVDEVAVASGQLLDAAAVATQMREARDGMAAHLASFTHNSSEFLRREQDLLLHGRGLPGTRTTFAGRPAVVVVAGHRHREELVGLRRYIREAKPVLVGVDRGADALVAAGHTPDVVVISGEADLLDRATGRALKAARDVVVRVERGSPASATAALRQQGIHPLRLETGATSEDAALVLAQRAGASVIVGVGMEATLEELLDRQRAGLASTFLTRLAVGPRLVDAASLPQLSSRRRRRRRQLVATAVAGLVAATALLTATTPVGRGWVEDLARQAVEPAPVRAEVAAPPPVAAPDARAAYADAFAQSVAGRAYAGGLAERGVALVVLPGVEAPVVEDLVAQIGAAGGAVTSTYAVQPPWLDPTQKSLVDTLGSQLAQQLTGTPVSPDATAYDRVGALLGAAASTTRRKGDAVPADGPTIVQSLEGAGLLATSAAAASRAALVLVVLGDDPGPGSDPAVQGLLSGLAGTARGVVVAGPSASASNDGALARLRGSALAPAVTTVDGVDGAAGRVTSTLALVRALTTEGGAFGASGADGAVPLG